MSQLKRLLSLLLVIMMLLSAVAFGASSGEVTENEITETDTLSVSAESQTNTAPVASKENDENTIILGEDYRIDLSEIFSDADETDILTYKVSVNEADTVAADTEYIFTPDETGKYTLIFTANDGMADSAAYTVTLTVNENISKPASLVIKHDAKDIIDGVIVTKKGDRFKLTAYDENGKETPVTWKNTSWNGGGVSLNENTGEIEVISDIYSGTSYLYFTATSTLDETIKKEITIQATGYLMSEYQKAQTIALSTDGQTVKTASLVAGKSGHNIWSYRIPEGVAELAQEPGNGGSIKFNVFRPGVIEVTFALDINEKLTDTATITVTGVAVEDNEGNRAKTYLGISGQNPNPTVQLLAFAAEGNSVESWESADETIATVDENGLVTAKNVGSTIITATDNKGTQGGIKVVVESEETPYFENLQFLSTAIKNYSTAYIFAPTTTDYNLEIKSYSTTKLTLQNTTLFDDEKYDAIAEYTDINGEKQSVSINNGAITYLEGIPFDESQVIITLSDKKNADNKTIYNFTVKRPRDTTKTIKSNGIVFVPDGRSLLTTKYNGYAEGTMFKLTEDGEFKISWGTSLDTGISGTHYSYKCFALGNLEEFSLNITGNTVYEHLRYSIDKENWTELAQGGGATEKISFDDEDSVTVAIQIIDDKTYTDNLNAEKDGFFDCKPNEYVITIEKAGVSSEAAQILTATTESGDWYPRAFNNGNYTYVIVVPKDVTEKALTYTVSEGATVKLGTTEQTASDGVYTLPLTTSQKTLTITSADGKVTNTYNFKIQKKTEGYPDKVIDFLCINSQYTNGTGAGNGASPWVSLAGNAASIGNFGGYITYYYEEAITDNPNNKYGIDFYVYGNANKDTSTSTKTSFFEPAQAWVSEDGEEWYALAGSAHYDEGVDWNYSVTYKRATNGKTQWVDSHGNSNDGKSASGTYPSASIYSMNDLAKSDTINLSGIVLPARNGEVAVSGEATDAYPVQWGYADCFVNGTKGADVNPYLDNTKFDLQTNGFDLKWAVDVEGNPVDVSNREFHYVKLVTVSNIWHSSFGDKSPEIAGVVKTKAQEEAVGKTSSPAGVTITDGADTKVISFSENEQIYSIDIGDMKYISISVNGAEESDNIYINNTRIAYDGCVDGFKITKEKGTQLVRIIVQNGDKEPIIYLLKIKGTATESNDLIEGIKLDVNGSSRTSDTKDGKVYTASVGYRISSVRIFPVAGSDVKITVNGEDIENDYSLLEGENIFEVTGKKDAITHSVTLKITKETAPASTGTIKVYFTLLGDDAHGDGEEIHTLKNGGLSKWISKTAIELDAPATVLDVLEKALEGKHTFVNADGNYISEIDGLAEFTNGANSGWMYTLNGKHPGKGVAEQSVKNGDKIVFHYSDDYTLEQGSEKWSSNSSSKKKEDKTEEPAKNETSAAFLDVAPNSWYKDAVSYVTEKKLFNGVSETEFAPESNMTRAMLVTVLYRLENPQEKEFRNVFNDVEKDQWYTDAVNWAAANGIVNGMNETTFAPDKNITREQMAAIMHRYAEFKKYDVSKVSNLSKFDDEAHISDWAKDALSWANGAGIITGTSETTVDPLANATRAQVATILMRYCENIVK